MRGKVILISYNYYPLVNPRALRWTSIAEHMVSLGYEVHVLCSKVNGESHSEVINGVNVYRVGVRGQNKPGLNKSVDNSKKPIKEILKLVYNKFFKHFIWPDSNMFWIYHAIKKGDKIIKENNIKKMISISHPFTGHVVGRKLFNKNKSLKWVADIGDPFAFLEFVNINNKFLYKQFNYFYEKKIVKESYAQCVTTVLTKDEYLKFGYRCKDSMQVIPPLLREKETHAACQKGNSSTVNDRSREELKSVVRDGVREGASKPISKNNKIQVSSVANRGTREEAGSVFNKKSINEINWIFVGTLYKKIRSPKYLLKLFSKVTDLDKENNHILHFYGETKMCVEEFEPYASKFGVSIILHGLVRPEVASKALGCSDLLINIGNKTSYQLPSKLVEYIALGKNIINIKSITNDSSAEFLEKYPLSIFVNESTDITIEAKNVMKNINLKRSIDKKELENLIQPYLVDEISKSYLSLFD